MSKRILVPIAEDFENRRKASLVENIKYWANRRDIDVDVLKLSEINGVNYEKYIFSYKTLTSLGDEDFIKVSGNLPLVIDRATIADPAMPNIYRGLRIAIRNPFASDVSALTPEQQVPLLPQPYTATKRNILRDVIIFDVKQFHDTTTHLYVAALLASVLSVLPRLEKDLGFKVSIYFTSFFDYGLYENLLEVVGTAATVSKDQPHLRELLKNRTIPPLRDHSEYLSLMERGRLLLTEHGDIADSDVVHALCLGVPTLTYTRDTFAISNGFQCSALQGVSILDPAIQARLDRANLYRITESLGAGFALRIGQVPAWDVSEYEKLYLRSWDILAEWAETGVVNAKLNKVMNNGRWNRGITTDKDHRRQITALTRG